MLASRRNKFYPFWLWVSTITLTPIGLFFWNMFINKPIEKGDNAAIFILLILFGFFFSFPAFLITFLIYQSIYRSSLPVWMLRLSTIGLALLSMIITLNIISGSMISDLKWSYSIAIILTGYSLNRIKYPSSDLDRAKLSE